jgi:triacylglycerol lipase
VVLTGLMVAYLAALTAAAANPAELPPHGVQMLTQGANVVTLGALLGTVAAFNRNACAAGRWSWSWATLAVLAANLAARGAAAVISPESNLKAKFTRWDTAATVVGTVAVLIEMYYALVPRMRLRTTFFVLGLVFVLPLVNTLPQLFRGAKFDADTALHALQASNKAYVNFAPTQAPKGGKGRQNEQERITSTYVESGKSGKVYISFAGTENNTDVKTDVNAGDSRVPPEWLRPGDPAVRVHSGFLRVYTQLRPRLLHLAKSARGGAPGMVSAVVLCGHSLGGALATLAALDLAGQSWSGGIGLELYTFGQPQVGDGAFVKLFNSRVPHAVRVVNPFDPVPRSLSAVFLHTKGHYAVTSFSRDSPLTAHDLATYDIALRRPQWARVAGIFAPLVYVCIAAAGVAVVRTLVLK